MGRWDYFGECMTDKELDELVVESQKVFYKLNKAFGWRSNPVFYFWFGLLCGIVVSGLFVMLYQSLTNKV